MNGRIFRIYISCFLLFIPIAQVFAKNEHKITPKAIRANIDSLNNKGHKLVTNNVTKALLMFVKAEQLATKYNYEQGLTASYLNQAEVFSQRGYTKRSLVLYSQALALSEQNHDEYHIAQCQLHISTVKRRSGEFTEAKRLLIQALAVYTKLHKPIDIVNAQLRLGLLAATQKQHNLAGQWYDRAYQTAVKANYQYGVKKSYFDRALWLEDLGKTDSALAYFNRALRIDTLSHDNYGKALSYLEKGKIYLKQHQLKKAQAYTQLSYLNADSVSGNDLTIQAITQLIDIYGQLNNVNGIVKWQEKLLAINQQLTEQDKKAAVAFINIVKEQEDNQVKYLNQIDNIKKVSQEKTIFLVSFLVIIVITVMLFIPLKHNYRRATIYAHELKEKNQQIIDKSAAVEQLNNQIVSQNKSLEEDNRLKNKLLSVISHDLRHPLVNTRSLLQIYNQQLLSPQEAKDLFAQLEAQYARTITLLDNLLFWIKRQVQHEPAAKTVNSLTVLIDELTEEQKLALYNKRITVVNDINTGIEWFADREALRIVFRNLLNNALKFTPDGGKIEFSSAINSHTTSISVKDNGIGMGPSKLERVVQGSYFSSGGTSGELGSGFGLILVRDLISAYQGTLSISSTAGVGSEFTITFPNTAMNAAAA